MINRKELVIKYLVHNIITIILIILTTIFYDDISLGYDNFGKLGFCFIFPLLSLLQSLILIMISLFEIKVGNLKNSKIFLLISKYLNLIFGFGQVLILLSIISVNISLITIMMELLGLFMLIIGNYFPKLKESNIIKSLSYKVNKDVNKWNRFTRVAGYTYLFLGLVIMLLGVVNEVYIIVLSLGLIIAIGFGLQLYSIALGKR